MTNHDTPTPAPPPFVVRVKLLDGSEYASERMAEEVASTFALHLTMDIVAALGSEVQFVEFAAANYARVFLVAEHVASVDVHWAHANLDPYGVPTSEPGR
jgi:hypothetical protein